MMLFSQKILYSELLMSLFYMGNSQPSLCKFALPDGGFWVCVSFDEQIPTTNTSQCLYVCRGVTTLCSQNRRSEVSDATNTSYTAQLSEIPRRDYPFFRTHKESQRHLVHIVIPQIRNTLVIWVLS